MAEREIVLDKPEMRDEQADALREANERAERAEAELTRLRNAQAHQPAPAESSRDAGTHAIPAVRNSDLKSPPTPSTASAREQGQAQAQTDRASEDRRDPGEADMSPEEGVAELRKDSMMAHLLDSLEAGKDIGHYGRLVFAMVARHFLPHDEVLRRMTADRDFSEEQARLMLRQVEGRDYNPPKRDRILEWQSEQEFPILPSPDDPDCGNLYRNLKFPDEVYQHIGHYQEKKMESEEEGGEMQRF